MDTEECRCECHSLDGPVAHMVQCCEVCAACGKRIAIEHLAEHDAACKGAKGIERVLLRTQPKAAPARGKRAGVRLPKT